MIAVILSINKMLHKKDDLFLAMQGWSFTRAYFIKIKLNKITSIIVEDSKK